jgi:hypothetical protein
MTAGLCLDPGTAQENPAEPLKFRTEIAPAAPPASKIMLRRSKHYARQPCSVFPLVGVLILFRWGMPFRVETHGEISIIAEQTDTKAIALDHIYTICGWAGLIWELSG